ncbi:MAG: hypothetical protein ACOZAG_02540 [Patescibacteria group bacterium]
MTNEERDELINLLMRKMEEGDYLTKLGFVPPSRLVVIAIANTTWWDPRRFKIVEAEVVERDSSRPNDGVLVKFFKKSELRRFPFDYPCLQMSAADD